MIVKTRGWNVTLCYYVAHTSNIWEIDAWDSLLITNVLRDQRQVLIWLVTCIEEVCVRKMEGETL